MKLITKRVEAQERRLGSPTGQKIDAVTIWSLGGDRERVSLAAFDPYSLKRRSGESVNAFEARAVAEAIQRKPGPGLIPQVVFLEYEELAMTGQSENSPEDADE